jgi:hypothetical protein
MKDREREKAIALRKKGKTYKEILKEVPVAKSTLSLWLRSVGLSVPQKQRITKARIEAALRGAESKRTTRLKEVSTLGSEGKKDIGTLSERDLWLIGIALHWAEGSKQNIRTPSTGIIFGNSDVGMIRVYLAWLSQLGVNRSDIVFELYSHIERQEDTVQFKMWWSKELSIDTKRIEKVYLKKGNLRTKRSNVGDLYHGLLRIKVKRSTGLNRKVQGWFEGIATALPE